MVNSIHMGALMCIMAISVTNGAQMVSPQLRVLPSSRRTLGVVCRGISYVVFGGLGG